MKTSVFQIEKELSIRPYERSDEDRFVEMSMDQEVIQYMSGTSGKEEEESALFQKIFTIYEGTSNARIFHIWGIYLKDQLVGHLELKETEHTTDKELEIVFMMHPDTRRKGIMRKVLRFIQNNQVFFHRRIIATVHSENKGSLKLLKKWGHSYPSTYYEDGVKFLKLRLSQEGTRNKFGMDETATGWGF